MNGRITGLLVLTAVVTGLSWLSGCAGTAPKETTSPNQSTAISQPDGAAAPPPAGAPDLSALATLAESLPTRTPVPTATPGVLASGASALAQEVGLAGKSLLGLEYSQWINLVISLLFILAGYLIGTGLIRWILPRLVRKTKTDFDDRLLQVTGNPLRWLVVVLTLRFATYRLEIIQAEVKTFLDDVFFFLALFLVALVVWRLINLAADQVKERARNAGDHERAASLIRLAVGFLRLMVIVFAVSILLTHFGINITGITIVLALVAVVLSLAARDVLADIVSGAIILIDRPFRVGDQIDLTTINSRGEVVDIGIRSTRILTWDNRLVIIPNSQIGKNQVVNYSYPDPSVYDMTGIVTAYENDVEQVAQLITDAVGSVEGVQKERPIDVLLMEFTENQMLWKTGWWIGSYNDMYPVRDRVNRAVIQALKEADIKWPFTKGSLNVEVNADKPG
jgi:small-conductance mechanosensitive channel